MLLAGGPLAARGGASDSIETAEADGQSVVLLRLQASVGGKQRNALDPLSGFKLLLAPLDGGETPPQFQKLRSPSKPSRKEGWIYLTLSTGDYFLLAVPPGRDQNPPAIVYHLDSARYGSLNNTSIKTREAFWNAGLQEFLVSGKPPADFEPMEGFWLRVPDAGHTYYAGTLSAACTGLRGIFGNLVGHCPPLELLDERPQAAALVASLPVSTPALSTVPLVPYGDLAPQARPIDVASLALQTSSVTDVAPGVGEPSKRPSSVIGGTSGVLVLLVLAAEGIDHAADRAAAAKTSQSLSPCMDRLAQRMGEMNVAAVVQTDLSAALLEHNVPREQSDDLERVQPQHPVDQPASRTLTASISVVKVRECVKRGTFCLEVKLLARLADAATDTSLYAANLMYVSPDVSIDPAARHVGLDSLPVESQVECHPVDDYCPDDASTAVFETELRQALKALANALALKLAGTGA
jgi:hypothetical protein